MKNLIVLSLLAYGSLTSLDSSAQTTLTGTSIFMVLNNDNTSTANGTAVSFGTLTGLTMTDDPTSSFNMGSIECRGIGLSAKGQTTPQSCNVCSVTDKDGDVFMYYSEAGYEAKSLVRLIPGTGKYRNLSGDGTASAIGGTADGKAVFKWEITYKM